MYEQIGFHVTQPPHHPLLPSQDVRHTLCLALASILDRLIYFAGESTITLLKRKHFWGRLDVGVVPVVVSSGKCLEPTQQVICDHVGCCGLKLVSDTWLLELNFKLWVDSNIDAVFLLVVSRMSHSFTCTFERLCRAELFATPQRSSQASSLGCNSLPNSQSQAPQQETAPQQNPVTTPTPADQSEERRGPPDSSEPPTPNSRNARLKASSQKTFDTVSSSPFNKVCQFRGCTWIYHSLIQRLLIMLLCLLIIIDLTKYTPFILTCFKNCELWILCVFLNWS